MPIEKIHVKIPLIGLIILVLAFLVPNITDHQSWLWGLISYGSTVRFINSLFHLLFRVVLSLIILSLVIKIFIELNKARKQNDVPDTYKRSLTKKSIKIIILTILILIANRVCLPYDINVNQLIQGGDFIMVVGCTSYFNVNFSLPGFYIFALFIGSIIIIIGAQLYNKEIIEDEKPSLRKVDEHPSPSKVENGEKGLSTKYPDVVVTKKNILYVLIFGILLSVLGSIMVAISLPLEAFFDNFDAFAQALGTGIGLMICGFAFLFMYFFMPSALKRLIATIKGSRSEQRAKRKAKKGT